MYSSIGDLAAEYGVDAAAEVAEFEVTNLAAVKSLIEEEGIECDLDVGNIFDVQFDDSHCAKVKAGYNSLVNHGLRDIQDVEYHSGETAEIVRLLIKPELSLIVVLLPGIRCQGRSRLFQLSCWSTVAVQARDPALETSCFSRYQSPDQYTRVIGV